MQYTGRSEWRKKAELLGDALISCNTVACEAVIPRDISSNHLYSNEIFEVNIVTEGSGICQVFGQSIPCNKGDIFVIPPDIPHNCFVADDTGKMHVSQLLFDSKDWFLGDVADIGTPRFCYGIFCGSPIIAYATLNAKTYDAILSCFESIRYEISEKQQDWKEAARLQLSMLFITLARYIGKAEQTQATFVKEWHYAGLAVQIVMENFSDRALKLETLAQMMYISKSHLSRLFREFTGEPFSQYLRTIRLNHACKLLRETDMPLEQILSACGDHYTEVIPATGKHSYDDGVTDPDNADVKIYTCTVCGDTYTEEIPTEPVLGDMNGDGAVTVVDVLVLVKAILNGDAAVGGDLSGDGAVTLIDVIRLMKMITA